MRALSVALLATGILATLAILLACVLDTALMAAGYPPHLSDAVVGALGRVGFGCLAAGVMLGSVEVRS